MQTEVGRALRTNDDDLDGRIEFFFERSTMTLLKDLLAQLVVPSVSTSKVEKFPTATFHQLSYDSAPNSIFLRINARDVKKWPREAAK